MRRRGVRRLCKRSGGREAGGVGGALEVLDSARWREYRAPRRARSISSRAGVPLYHPSPLARRRYVAQPTLHS
jgi:hypothetical protein